MQRILSFVGFPGCGKGTHSKELKEFAEHVGISSHILSTSGLIQAALSEGRYADIEMHVREQVRQGDLVSPAFPITSFMDFFFGEKEERYDLILMDGFFRHPIETEVIGGLLQEMPQTFEVVLLNIPCEVARKRLIERAEEEGREDDREEIVQKRLDLYNCGKRGTMASIKILRDMGFPVYDINGDRPIDVVFRDLLKTLRFEDCKLSSLVPYNISL